MEIKWLIEEEKIIHVVVESQVQREGLINIWPLVVE
jgi:hypothetical protein